MAIWISMAAMGARIIMAMAAMGLPPRRRRRGEPPNQKAMRATKVMAAGDHGGDRADQDVAVQDVAELVGDDAFELAIAHQAEDAGGEGHRGVRRVAAGGEGVGRIARG